jgi:hypothetical protein
LHKDIPQKYHGRPRHPTEAERAQAREQAKDEYLAVMFLVNYNRQCYGLLVRDIKNEYTQGSDTYPTTLITVYNYIVNYQPAKGSRTNTDEGGIAFYIHDEDDTPGHG